MTSVVVGQKTWNGVALLARNADPIHNRLVRVRAAEVFGRRFQFLQRDDVRPGRLQPRQQQRQT